MNHPLPEEWIDFLYGELEPGRHRECQRHLEACAECRARVEDWRATRQELAEWKSPPARADLPPPLARPPARIGLPRLAAAAALVLAGYGLAIWGPRPGGESADDLAARLRGEMRAEFAAFAADQAAREAVFQQNLTQTLGGLEALRQRDYQDLRREVETLAVQAADELAGTRQSLARLTQTP